MDFYRREILWDLNAEPHVPMVPDSVGNVTLFRCSSYEAENVERITKNELRE
jgi:hypothetical protein